jgi:hypothetical protein
MLLASFNCGVIKHLIKKGGTILKDLHMPISAIVAPKRFSHGSQRIPKKD